MRSISRTLGNVLILVSFAGLGLVALGLTSAPNLARLELTPIAQFSPTATQSKSAFPTAQSDALIAASVSLSDALSAAPAPFVELEPLVQPGRADTQPDDAPANVTPPAPTLLTAVRTSTPTPVTAATVPVEATPSTTANLPTSALDPLPDAELEALDSRPITRVILPRIALTADVVPAELVEQDDGLSWMVPAFKAGHAQYTAGPGEVGNSVLFGHVTSRSLGNVFEQLYRARVGDLVELFDGSERFDYRVVEVRAVSRTDTSVLAPTESASVSLITCTGIWNAALHDYMERLVVRAELIG